MVRAAESLPGGRSGSLCKQLFHGGGNIIASVVAERGEDSTAMAGFDQRTGMPPVKFKNSRELFVTQEIVTHRNRAHPSYWVHSRDQHVQMTIESRVDRSTLNVFKNYRAGRVKPEFLGEGIDRQKKLIS